MLALMRGVRPQRTPKKYAKVSLIMMRMAGSRNQTMPPSKSDETMREEGIKVHRSTMCVHAKFIKSPIDCPGSRWSTNEMTPAM